VIRDRFVGQDSSRARRRNVSDGSALGFFVTT
jgi:hypothetical protein